MSALRGTAGKMSGIRMSSNRLPLLAHHPCVYVLGWGVVGCAALVTLHWSFKGNFLPAVFSVMPFEAAPLSIRFLWYRACGFPYTGISDAAGAPVRDGRGLRLEILTRLSFTFLQ
jgi:hypothetical protein